MEEEGFRLGGRAVKEAPSVWHIADDEQKREADLKD